MDNSKVTYRNANINDISDIMTIEYTSFADIICEDEEVFLERIKTFPEGFRVMECNGQVVGYICSELWKRVTSLSEELFTLGHSIKEQHSSKGKELYISSMGLMPEFRSKGLGSSMFDEFIKHMTSRLVNIESIVLIVSEKWSKARSIYAGNGFKEIDTLRRFFHYDCERPYHEDAIVMRKQLQKT